MLFVVKEWLSYCLLWGQKEEVILFIMYLGRGKKEGKNFYLINCSVKIYCILYFCNFFLDCRIYICFDNFFVNFFVKCIIF